MYIGKKTYQRQVFKMLWDNATVLLDAGKAVDVTVSEHKIKRTNAQNNYYWLFNGELAKFLDEAGLTYGEYKLPYTGELVHEINKKLFQQNLFPNLPGKTIKCTDLRDGVKIIYTDDTWSMVRMSGTEPVLRIYTEMHSQKECEKVFKLFEKHLDLKEKQK